MTLSHYIDLKPVPEEDLKIPQAMGSLFEMLHKALAFSGERGIAISLPHHSEGTKKHPFSSLGDVLRLHGAEQALQTLLKRSEFRTLADYVYFNQIQPVPRETKNCVIRRVQVKSGTERLRRRAIKRHHLTEEEAKERYPDGKEALSFLPYFSVKSLSTDQKNFRLFLSHKMVEGEPVEGIFSAYGLGIKNEAGQFPTIPWF
ncbi:type I-F CRISPR-associated endoribonuclease Cas6/Csy4 [Acetobacteraceae bacterium]|nr:type I-F CRISPR-associated endoribonuclease Cas6/Csy4 [Acetobacteraceae bacterium]